MQRIVSWRRAAARALLMSLTVLTPLAACEAIDPVPAPLPVQSTPAALCRPTGFVAAGHEAQIAAGRERVPAITDDLTAYVVGLLPEPVVAQTRLSITNGPTDNGLPLEVFPKGLTLTIAPDSGLAPADLAFHLMFTATVKVLVDTSLDATDLSQLATIQSVATTVAVDTYIKLAAERPESTNGAHLADPRQDIVTQVRARLSKDFTQTVTSFDGRALPDAPLLLLRTMSNWFGHTYYRQTSSRVYGLNPPVDESTAAALVHALNRNC